jgi:RNA 3'-terminal phosphate cyclase-like protein
MDAKIFVRWTYSYTCTMSQLSQSSKKTPRARVPLFHHHSRLEGSVFFSIKSHKGQKYSITMSKSLKFEDGASQFRQRLVLSLLSHRPILISNIRADDLQNPGLKDYEASFLRLIDSMTNGSRMEINNTGTQIRFQPGVLLGGDIEHICPDSRSTGWFLEGILPLAPFGKEPLSVFLHGITDGCCETDPSPDYLQKSAIPLFSRFGIGIDEDEFSAQIKVLQRAAAPTGGGKVHFTCPIVKELQPIDFTDPGKIKRIRGTAISCKIVSTSMAARVSYAAKGVFHKLLPDVWIHTDAHTPKNHKCGPSPGLSLVVSSESTTGVIITAEVCLDKSQRGAELPEELGQRGACMLFEEIRRGGCIDTSCQSLAFIWMCLTPEDASRIRVGTISQYSVETLRLLKRVFDVEFKVKPEMETKTVMMSCLGTGYRNMAKAST